MSVPRNNDLPQHSYGSGAHYGELPLEALPAGDTTGDVFYYSGSQWNVVPLSTVAGSGSSSGMVNPMTTLGDLIFGQTGGAPVALPAGIEGQFLTVISGVPYWTDMVSGNLGLCQPDVISTFSGVQSLGGTATDDGANYAKTVVTGPNVERVQHTLSRGASVGQAIVVLAGHNHNADPSWAVYDSRGNTYTLAADHRKAISGAQPRVGIWFTNVSTPLQSGDVIGLEVDVGSSLLPANETGPKGLTAYLYDGELSAPTESGTGSAASSSPSVTVGAGDLIVAGLVTKAVNAATVTEDVDWTAFDDVKSTTTAPWVLVAGGWRLNDADGENWTGTLDSAHDWAMVGAVFTTSESTTNNDGHPDLVGTSTRVTRCDHRHDVHRDSAPTVNDDEGLGYKVGTVWAQLDSLVTPTSITAVWVLADATDGAAVWLEWPGGSPAAADVSITDAGGYFTGTDVEAALQELGAGSVASYLEKTGGEKHTVNTVASSGATETLNLADGNLHDVTLSDNCTFTFSGATNGVGCYLTLILRQDATGNRTVTWPASVEWPDDTAPTLSTAANAVDVLSFLSNDGGTTWFGAFSGSVTASTIQNIGHWETIVSGSAPPVAVTNEAADDWLVGWVDG